MEDGGKDMKLDIFPNMRTLTLGNLFQNRMPTYLYLISFINRTNLCPSCCYPRESVVLNDGGHIPNEIPVEIIP